MQYSEFVEKLKSGHIYTHGGVMHADDVLSTALINKVCDKEKIPRPKVHRMDKSSDVVKYQKDNIVYDIGCGEFDHHQKDIPVRKNGMYYAAFGRIFDNASAANP